MDLYGRVESARTGLVAASVAGRDAVEAAIPAELRGAYRAAWNARAAPGSQRDPKDALPAIDRARGLADLTDRQRAQLDALRNDHAARHAAACNAIAELQVGQTMRDARTADADATIESIFDSSRLLEDARFERTELNARSLRRLRSMLTPEQVKQVPALAPRRRGMPMGAMPGLSPATIQAEPAPTSP
jgi:Spy/CpxP family protein refolding chaperone